MLHQSLFYPIKWCDVLLFEQQSNYLMYQDNRVILNR